MYQNIKSRVKHDGSFSQMFAFEIGVRQGENLSPLLFSLFLNDLELHMISNGAIGVELNFPDDTTWLKLLLLLYAYDTVILSDDPIDFQNSLDIFNEYCIDWHLTNARKLTPLTFLYGELCRYPVSITIKRHMILFWNRFMTGNREKLSFPSLTF